MNTRALCIVLICCSTTLGAISFPEAQQGNVEVVVVSTDTQPQPVRRAVVTLSGGGLTDIVSAVSDGDGRTVFTDVPPGRYTVTVTKPAYLTTVYGASRAGRPGTPVPVTAGSRASIRVPLAKGGIISGTIRDERGQPMPGIQVVISPASTIGNASRTLVGEDIPLTDDRGAYRAFGLLPGEYVVSAVPPRFAGSGGDLYVATRADVDARLRVLTQGGAPPSIAEPTSALSTEARPIGHAPVYHPGTAIVSEAGRIRIAPGDERNGVDIRMLPVRTARIAGTIQSGEISPARLRPTLTPIGPPLPIGFTPTLTGPAADGSFSFAGVTPGRYSLLARTGMGAMMATLDGRGSTTNNPTVPSTFAVIELDVNGVDQSGLSLVLQPTPVLAGRVDFDGAATPPASVRIAMVIDGQNTVAGGGLSVLSGGSAPSTAMGADRTFSMPGLLPGSYSISTAVPGWRLRSAIVNGRDILDHPLVVTSATGSLEALLTLSDKRSEVFGTLAVGADRSAADFTVLAYPVDRTLWRPGARRIKAARPGADGGFSVMDLPAGDYFIAALTDAVPDDWQQPEFLEQLVAASIKLAVTEGGRTQQDIRVK